MAIHQPRTSIWNLFDNVVIMAGGRVVFHGSRDDSIIWIENLTGKPIPDYENPADHIMDTLQEMKTLPSPWNTLKTLKAYSKPLDTPQKLPNR